MGKSDQLQLIFDEVTDKRRRQKELKAFVKQQLEGNEAYARAKDEYGKARERLKSAKAAASRDLGKEMDEIDSLRMELNAAEESASAVSLSELQAGRAVAVTTSLGVRLVPVLRVQFVVQRDAGEEN